MAVWGGSRYCGQRGLRGAAQLDLSQPAPVTRQSPRSQQDVLVPKPDINQQELPTLPPPQNISPPFSQGYGF